jgi:hypothetical protein
VTSGSCGPFRRWDSKSRSGRRHLRLDGVDGHYAHSLKFFQPVIARGFFALPGAPSPRAAVCKARQNRRQTDSARDEYDLPVIGVLKTKSARECMAGNVAVEIGQPHNTCASACGEGYRSPTRLRRSRRQCLRIIPVKKSWPRAPATWPRLPVRKRISV